MNWFQETLLSPRFWTGRQNKHEPLTRPVSVSIVIPAYNEQEHIIETLEACKMQTYPCRIIVVDDASTDKTAMYASYKGAHKVIRAEVNQGSKSRAINLAIPEITEDIMIVVDADTSLAPDAVEKLVHAFSDPEVMVACGIVHSRNYDTFWEKARHAEYLCTQYIIKRAQGNARMVLVASGCFSAFRAEWLRSVGGFPERSMAEDMDLTWEAITEGKRVALCMDAHCVVTDPKDWPTYRNQLLRWYRGFLQCLKVRRYWMGWNRLTFVAYSYFVSAIVGALALFWFIASGFPVSLVGYFSMIMLIPFSVVLFHSMREGKTFWQVVTAFICMALALPINLGLMLTAVYLELIKGDTLEQWHKGH